MKRILAATLIISVLAATMLAGCSVPGHQVIDKGQDCKDCHSATRKVYDDITPTGATAVNSTVAVTTQSSKVWICKVHVTQKDGSYFVPEIVSEVSVSDGKTTVTLDEGTWALCAGHQTSPSAKLVTVSVNGASEVNL